MRNALIHENHRTKWPTPARPARLCRQPKHQPPTRRPSGRPPSTPARIPPRLRSPVARSRSAFVNRRSVEASDAFGETFSGNGATDAARAAAANQSNCDCCSMTRFRPRRVMSAHVTKRPVAATVTQQPSRSIILSLSLSLSLLPSIPGSFPDGSSVCSSQSISMELFHPHLNRYFRRKTSSNCSTH